VAWGLPPRASWFARRSRFLGCEVTDPAGGSADGFTLEQYLGVTSLAGATDRPDTGE
jgi:hypothetical protein